jgi:transposase-like protein
MKNELMPEPDEITLDKISQYFNTDETAREYLESLLWPNGAVCPHCKNNEAKSIWKIKANKEKKIREGLYRCAKCDKEFTCTVGTIFEDSHIPLRKWLVAFYLNSASKKGISSLQLQRILGLGSYRTALFMQHRIRHALRETGGERLTGIVEVDETYVGGRVTRGKYKGDPLPDNKTPVVSVLQRGGKVRSQVVKPVTGKNLREVIRKNIKRSKTTTIMTDNFRAYKGATKGYVKHESVNHSAKEYVRGDAHTNGVEGFFSLLKRGVMGTFHHISEQHLPLYLAEFDHRHNFRDVTDGERTVEALKMAEGKRLMYRQPAN